ncbi:hypothetical protein BOTNAR_0221g00150 [Botryotinia narcissicola]|uniref:Uncharacterized protein n=1 Tax=Botryotinia narcissicola TaxID=278944 RepID=A0A4Z1I5D0_9HELO|nr:hypothetical protein BOTNAR_0221g00150 [Botryotinia narcissicola]
MGNEVSAQRVTFGSCPPCPPYTQAQQETSLNTDTPSTKKRKHEDSEEYYSRKNVRKRRKLLVMDDGSHSILTFESLIVVLEFASLSSFRTICQNRKSEGIEKCGISSRKAETSDAVLNRLAETGETERETLEEIMGKVNGQKAWTGSNWNPILFWSTRTVKFGSKASPDMNGSTSSAAEDWGQVFVELKLPKNTVAYTPTWVQMSGSTRDDGDQENCSSKTQVEWLIEFNVVIYNFTFSMAMDNLMNVNYSQNCTTIDMNH